MIDKQLEFMSRNVLKEYQLDGRIQVCTPIRDNSTEICNTPSQCAVVLSVLGGKNGTCKSFNHVPLSQIVQRKFLVHTIGFPRCIEPDFDEDEVDDTHILSLNVSKPPYSL